MIRCMAIHCNRSKPPTESIQYVEGDIIIPQLAMTQLLFLLIHRIPKMWGDALVLCQRLVTYRNSDTPLQGHPLKLRLYPLPVSNICILMRNGASKVEDA